MAERPTWFKGVVQGGKPEGVPAPVRDVNEPPKLSEVSEEKPAEAPPTVVSSKRERKRRRGREGVPQKSPEEIKQEGDLVNLFIHLMDNTPANFDAMVNQQTAREHLAKRTPSWTVATLNSYLSGGDIWQKPSLTMAVFYEIRERIKRGNMAPRE